MPRINMEGFKEDGLYRWHLTDVKFRQGIRLNEATHHQVKTHSVEVREACLQPDQGWVLEGGSGHLGAGREEPLKIIS